MINEIVGSREVVGVEVFNTEYERLGKIEEIMLDKINGQVQYVVLSFGGFLGLGDKLFAMPWDMFNYDIDNLCFVIKMDKETLHDSPGFDKNDWPDMTDKAWQKGIHDFYKSK